MPRVQINALWFVLETFINFINFLIKIKGFFFTLFSGWKIGLWMENWSLD